MSAKGRGEEVRKRLRYNKKKDKRSVEDEWEGMVNPQNLWKLSFEVLSSVDHRISSDQVALKEKLGEFGPEFDSLIHSLTNIMLFKDPFLHADDFLEMLRQLLVTRSGAMVCTPEFFDAWLTTKAYAKGKTGKERWKKHYSAQKCMLLAARRLYVLMPTPSILFGCLSTVNLSKSSLSKNLGLIDAGAADAPEPVYLDRVPFSTGTMYEQKCNSVYRMSLGHFFNVSDISTNPKEPAVLGPLPMTTSPDLRDMPDGKYENNPWQELLSCTGILFSSIGTFADGWVGIEDIERVYTWPDAEAFRSGHGPDPVFDDKTVFEIISIVRVPLQKILEIDATERNENFPLKDWPETRVERLLALQGPLSFIIDLFLNNVRCSDVHYFFAYYRGEF